MPLTAESSEMKAIRSSAVLTTSYVAGTSLVDCEKYTHVVLYVNFTIGSLTSLELKVEYSNDGGTTLFQETARSISASTITETNVIHQFTATGKYRVVIPVQGHTIKVSVKGTGTVTSSAVAVDASLKTGPFEHLQQNKFTELIAGEDLTNDVLKVEQRFSYAFVQADAQVKGSAGFLHALTFHENDAAPTAGTIDVYDNTAGSGTKVFSWTLTTTVFMPVTVVLNCVMATGIYIDLTTTADVNVTASFR